MSYVKKRSALPVYFIGGTWLLWALLAPLYRPTHYIMAALASFILLIRTKFYSQKLSHLFLLKIFTLARLFQLLRKWDHFSYHLLTRSF